MDEQTDDYWNKDYWYGQGASTGVYMTLLVELALVGVYTIIKVLF
jgi:hypothetical protein